MRISGGFEARNRKLRDAWHKVCDSLEEPTSSLEEFETAIAFAQISIDERPPVFRRARRHIEEALRTSRAESFPILDTENLDRLRKSSSRLMGLHTQAEALREEILRRHRPASFTTRLSGKRYVVAAAEMEERLRNAAHNLASSKVASGAKGTVTAAMVQKVADRARVVRNRYLKRKITFLREYLETGAHRSQLQTTARHVVAELRFRQMGKREIDQLVSHFGRGSSRRQIDSFVQSLTGNHRYTVYTMVPAFEMESAKTALPGVQLLQQARLMQERAAPTGLPRVLSGQFRALAQDTVIAESAVAASNPAEAVAKARIALDAVASLVAYLDLEKPNRGSFLRESASLVYEGQRLARAGGIGAVRDDSFVLRPSMNRELGRLLGTIGVNSPQSSRTELQERVLTSMHWYMLGTSSRTLEERYVDHVISLEVLLSGKQTEREKSRVVAERATTLRRVLQVGRDEHMELIRRLYASRNALVHAGLYRARSLLQDSRDLESAVLTCLFAVLEGIKAGCHTLTELLDRIDKERVGARNRRIRNSRLSATAGAAFRGRLLLSSGKKIADIRGRLELIDEGVEGYAYHDLIVTTADYKKPLRITSADEYWFKGRVAGHSVELREGWLVGGGSLFFVIGGGRKRFTYRAFDNVVFR